MNPSPKASESFNIKGAQTLTEPWALVKRTGKFRKWTQVELV